MRKIVNILGLLLLLLVIEGCQTAPPAQSRVTMGTQESASVAAQTLPSPAPLLRNADWVETNMALRVETPPAVTSSPLNTTTLTNAIPLRSDPEWISLESWAAKHALTPPQALVISGNHACQLVTSKGMLRVIEGHRFVQWNGMDIGIGYSPLWVEGRLHVHSIDAEKNFRPLIFPPQAPEKPGRVLVIDPGHGGESPGARSAVSQRLEKELTLDLARRLRTLVSVKGWTVYLTRTNDVEVASTNRTAFADHVHADLFLSLHFNSSAPNPSPSGVETYCLSPCGIPSNLRRGYDDDLSALFPNNAFDAENLMYAERLHRSLLTSTSGRDRGVRRARFIEVLRGPHCPAVLIEGGFLSNLEEARKIGQAEYRQKLAEAIASAL